jgi:hypothetical protein
MSYFRSYFDKNNTILKNLRVNTSKNPTTEIYYGSGFSKFIFKVNFNDLKNKTDNGEFVIDNNTTHKLRLTNTIFGDEGLKGNNRTTGRDRANSFDLILFKINQYWDEGIGLDYVDESWDFVVNRNKTYSERPSNWYYRTSMNTWSTPGVYGTNPIILETIHFDNGDENIDVDITSYVNDILISGVTNHGLGLAFATVYEDVNLDTDQSVAFFTKYTQTFYEPYVESFFDDRVLDNRFDFTEKTTQNLFLYVTKGSNMYNLDELPLVDILDNNNVAIPDLENLVATHVRKGVYKISFALNGINCDGKKFFYDNWKNLFLDGSQEFSVKQKFIPKNFLSTYTVGSQQTEVKRYKIQFFGIKHNEKITSGDIRKIVITFRSIDNPSSVVLNDVYYRIYVKEGLTQVSVHDWTSIDVSNENFFYLDTSYFIPREYYMEIKGKIHGEEIHYTDSIKFEIVSEK